MTYLFLKYKVERIKKIENKFLKLLLNYGYREIVIEINLRFLL